MSFFNFLYGKTPKPKQQALGRDKDGNELFEEDIVAFVKNELERRKIERRPFELQWQLNCNFLAGNQNCDVNSNSLEVQQQNGTYDYLEHEVFNKIAPIMETRSANLKRLKYIMTVRPRTNELEDYEKAKICTELLRYVQSNSEFEKHKNNMIQWAEICGSVFVVSSWDREAGEIAGSVYEVTTEDGEVETEKIKNVHEGDIRYGLLNPFEVYPESVFKQTMEEQRSIITEQVLSTEDIYDLYGLSVDGEDIDAYTLTPVAGAGGYGYESSVLSFQTAKRANSKKVITYFEKGGREYPDGRLAIIVGDTLVHYGTLMYDTIPITVIKSKEVAGCFFGKSPIEDLIPLQRAYNKAKNTLQSYANRVIVGGWIVEDGSIDTDEYEEHASEPGAILTFRKGFAKPEQISSPGFPNSILNEIQQLANDMEYAAGVSQLMVIGATPAGVTSGAAIQNLREIDNTRLSLTGDNIRNAVLNLAKTWLQIYKKYATGNRVIRVVGKNSAGNALSWNSDTINSYDIKFDTENELNLSEDAQKQNLINALNMGLFTDDDGKVPRQVRTKMLELMKVGGYTEIMSINELQIQGAQRENQYLRLGIVPTINELDDDDIHLEEHERMALQLDFQILKKNNEVLAQAFVEHIKQHKQAKQLKLRQSMGVKLNEM